MRAYHTLRADYTAGHGSEAPWAVGETRTVEPPIRLCKRGYHSSPTLLDAVELSAGPVLCLVDVQPVWVRPRGERPAEQVSATRTLLAAADCAGEVRRVAAWYAEFVVSAEREAGRHPDRALWDAAYCAWVYGRGATTLAELQRTWAAAEDVTQTLLRGHAHPAAWLAAVVAAYASHSDFWHVTYSIANALRYARLYGAFGVDADSVDRRLNLLVGPKLEVA